MNNLPTPSLQAIRAELARRSFPDFIQFTHPHLCGSSFHGSYYRILELFARGEIRKLIVTLPPQHGKSLGATVLLPAYLLGINPDLRIAIASYNAQLATRFNRQIQRILESRAYATAFPDTRTKQGRPKERGYIRTAEEFEIVGRAGGVLAVGREGMLTGNPVDVMIIDDLYKDASEGNSPVVRDNTWEWYVSVVKTRLHNNSRELIVMTRWHEDDLVGRIARKESICELVSPERPAGQPEEALERPAKTWFQINFEAIKSTPPTRLDPRGPGEALWPERQGVLLLREKQALDPVLFDCLYQGQPFSRQSLLYGDLFHTYTDLPKETLKKGNYTDTADTGEDYLCSVCYEVGREGTVYITDLIYTQQAMEYTEEAVAALLNRNATRIARIESNNGGRGFARNVAKLCPLTHIEWFHQSANKESRILTNQPTVLKTLCFPADWSLRWSDFYRHVTGYRRLFRNNRFHDAADVLTGIVETEIVHKTDKSVKKIRLLR